MMEDIRVATPEEVESIRAHGDFIPTSQVIAFGKTLAVLRLATELDPVFFAEGMSDSQKLYFIKNLETHMRLTGVPVYYFNIEAGEGYEKWRGVVERYGAEKVSSAPEFRYRKVLINVNKQDNNSDSQVRPD